MHLLLTKRTIQCHTHIVQPQHTTLLLSFSYPSYQKLSNKMLTTTYTWKFLTILWHRPLFKGDWWFRFKFLHNLSYSGKARSNPLSLPYPLEPKMWGNTWLQVCWCPVSATLYPNFTVLSLKTHPWFQWLCSIFESVPNSHLQPTMNLVYTRYLFPY